MFEAITRLAKFIKYTVQGLIGLLGLFNALNISDITVIIWPIACLILTEGLARIVVWIVSGYFETCSTEKISQEDLTKMKNWYSFVKLRNKLVAWADETRET